MKFLIVNSKLLLLIAIILLILYSLNIKSQSLVVTNPVELFEYELGQSILNDEYKTETHHQDSTALLEAMIASEFTAIHSWEKSYTKYLQDVSGFASSLKAASKLFDDGLRIFIEISKISSDLKNNPEGAIATLSLNNIYQETISEFLSVYKILDDAIATGGKENMLSAYERSSLLWLLDDKLSGLSKKLSRLHYSLKMFTLTDAWHRLTLGIVERSNKEIARDALSRWKRAASY